MKLKKTSKASLARTEKLQDDVRDADDAGDDSIPTLTEIVATGGSTLSDETLASLHAQITTNVLKLAEELLHSASREMEAVLFEKVCDRLRAQLPELIDASLRAQLK